MLINDEDALREWLVATLEPLCDAEPIALARYVLALVVKDKPLDKLRENCIDRLEVFLDRATKDFVDQLFDVIRNERYIPEGKKENVQPKASEPIIETSEILEEQNLQSSTKQEDIQQTEAISSSVPISQPIKRRYSSRHHTNTDSSNHHQASSNKRQSTTSPPAKRTQRSYSHSSSNSSSPASPTNPNSLHKKIPCKDFFDNKGYCSLGDSCPNDHGSNILPFEQQNYYPSYQQYEIPSSSHHQYNPEVSDYKYNPHQFMMNPQRTLVTVVTNAEPLPLEQRTRQNDSSGPMPSSMNRTKRHVITAPYPTDRRTQQREHHSNNNNNNNNDGQNNRGRKRPWQKPDGSGSASTTLEIRKIPNEFNTISKLNEHFSKFGTVTNVQIAYDGFPDSALIAYGTFQEAETAYKNPEPLFNNRFIKIFWHNPNKVQTSGNNTNPKPTSSDVQAKIAPNPAKLHWSKTQKPPTNKNEAVQVQKRRATIPPAPSSIKKEAAKKAAIEIRRKKHGLLEEQIQQQKLLLKKLETAETNEEKESIRSLMKKIDSNVVIIKDSLRTIPVKSSLTPKMSQQDVLKQRTQTLQKQIDSLRAKTSADMRRAMSSTLETNPNRTNDADGEVDEEERLLTDNGKARISNESNQQYELETHDEAQLLDS